MSATLARRDINCSPVVMSTRTKRPSSIGGRLLSNTGSFGSWQRLLNSRSADGTPSLQRRPALDNCCAVSLEMGACVRSAGEAADDGGALTSSSQPHSTRSGTCTRGVADRMRGVNCTLAAKERDAKERHGKMTTSDFGFSVVRRAGTSPRPQLALRTTRLPFLEAVLLALVEQVRLGAAQVDNLRTPVSLPKGPTAQPKQRSVGTGIRLAAKRRRMSPCSADGLHSEPHRAGRRRIRQNPRALGRCDSS
jgi:hypothetical protein